jgi:hypothetical protein
MRKVNQLLGLGLLLALSVAIAPAQRPRTISSDPAPSSDQATTQTVQPAPQTVKVKYEGGYFGYNKKIDGTLNFDDANKRLVFRNKYQQEVLSLPYDAIASAFADTQSKRPIAADIASRVTIFALPAMLIRRKFRYLTLQYSDQDTNMSGVTSFKMENKEILASTLHTLAQKAGLTQRGEVFIRRKETASDQK